MRFIKQFLLSVAAVFASFSKVGIRAYLVIIALCFVLFVGGLFLGGTMFSFVFDLLNGLVSTIALPDFCSGVLPDALPGVASWVGGIAASLIAFLAVGAIGGSVIMLVLSPLLDRMADNGWVASGHKRIAYSVSDTVRSILRGVAIAFRCLLLQLGCLLLLLILSFLPVIGVAAPVLGLLVSSFFYGQTLIDYAVERAERFGAWGGKKPGSFPFSNIGLTVGLGFLFAVLTLIPFIGAYFALFVAPASAFAGGKVLGDAVKSAKWRQ